MVKSTFNNSIKIFSSGCQYFHYIAGRIGRSSQCLLSDIDLQDSMQASCSENLSAMMEFFLAITSPLLLSSPLLSSTIQIAIRGVAFLNSKHHKEKNNCCPSKFQELCNGCCQVSLHLRFLPK